MQSMGPDFSDMFYESPQGTHCNDQILHSAPVAGERNIASPLALAHLSKLRF